MNKYAAKMKELGTENFFEMRGEEKPPPVSEEQLQEAERELGFSLPADYREFLTDFGNSYMYDMVTVRPLEKALNCDVEAVENFLGITKGPDDGLAEKYWNYQGRMPSELLPIASDPGGSWFCLSLAGENRGCVYFWFNELEPLALSFMEPVPTDYSNVFLVARSFDEFMHGLMVEPYGAGVGPQPSRDAPTFSSPL